MKQFLLFLHQLPQNLLGLIVYLFTNPRRLKCFFDNQWHYYYVAQRNKGGWGVSLGNFIFFGYEPDQLSIKHEYGHQIQSLYLGWLYLIVVGLPSAVFNNLWDRIFHKNWSHKKREQWYYNRYPEKWADKLGNVERF